MPTAATSRLPGAARALTSDDGSFAGCKALLADARKVTIRLVDVNEHFICKLCDGYFRDAHKIKECAHTFCAGCIRNFFWKDKRHNSCPTCRVHLGPKPWKSLVADPAIQGLADKLLPSFKLREDEEMRVFYERLGLKRKPRSQAPQATGGGTSSSSSKRRRTSRESYSAVSPDGKATGQSERITFTLVAQKSSDIPLSLQLDDLKNRRMNAEATFRIHELRKYVAMALQVPDDDERPVEILCHGRPVGGEYSLAFVYKTIWRDPHNKDRVGQDEKMVLEYRRTVM